LCKKKEKKPSRSWYGYQPKAGEKKSKKKQQQEKENNCTVKINYLLPSGRRPLDIFTMMMSNKSK
jgi:hypothetical protein